GRRVRNVTGVQTCALPISILLKSMSLFSILIIGFPELAQKFNQIPEFALAKNITHGKHGRRGMLSLGNLIFGYMLYLPTGRLKQIGRASCREECRLR